MIVELGSVTQKTLGNGQKLFEPGSGCQPVDDGTESTC
jgi:hypothetical protein